MFYWIYLTSCGKEVKCEACRAFYLFFRNEFNKFNKIRARVLDSIYHMTNTLISHFWRRERSGSVIECLTRDRGAAGSSLTGITVLCPWARHINPSLVLVQPRKTRPFITEILLMGRKESNKTKTNHFWRKNVMIFSPCTQRCYGRINVSR